MKNLKERINSLEIQIEKEEIRTKKLILRLQGKERNKKKRDSMVERCRKYKLRIQLENNMVEGRKEKSEGRIENLAEFRVEEINEKIKSLKKQIVTENERILLMKRKIGREKEKDHMKIRLINIRGLTLNKWVDIQNLFFGSKEKNLVCLTETKQKVERFQCNEKLVKHETMRDERDGKEGGGLQIWARKCEEDRK